ncbi:hypothetical protein H5410_038958 [Solanum commersonii]|uniref:Uncharacterized protein n=1 Tax=Solanum commersonii TaxID=4109 RepID=A0A9J5YFC7_SOLCO|nr:hypothetical protein H5410_038958 [Solanum commersonii]
MALPYWCINYVKLTQTYVKMKACWFAVASQYKEEVSQQIKFKNISLKPKHKLHRKRWRYISP